MALPAGQDEQTIINDAYSILEQDNNFWDSASIEYLTARQLIKVGVGRWEHYENTDWPELYVRLADAPDGDKVTTANTFTYTCPTAFVRIISYIRTQVGQQVPVFWRVINPNEFAQYIGTPEFVCYITGNKATGYTIHFNPSAALPAGASIDYEYFSSATITAATTDKVQMSDPNFLSYFIASHMADGGLNTTFFNIAEDLLDNMQSAAESGTYLTPNSISESLDQNKGFGV